MKKHLTIAATVFGLLSLATLSLTISSQSQTTNMGRTYVSSQNVRYANEAGTGTTVNKLAKLTGAPSTAIITATTDTAGIIGIVVAGAGTTGNADIAFKGKALCVFDSATTAGHYVKNDASTAGDCEDAGATYPTSGQVIGVVTSTNGGAGSYEVDLTLGQPQAGGAGGGGSTTIGPYASLPATCTAGNAYIPTDSAYDTLICGAGNVWNHFRNGQLLTPPVLADFAWINQGGATAVNTYGGVYMSAPIDPGDKWRILKKAAPSTPYTITVAMLLEISTYNNPNGGGPLFRQSSDGKLVAARHIYESSWRMDTCRFDSPTAFSGTYGNVEIGFHQQVIWIRITDDGVNRTSSWSTDGLSFVQYLTVGRTDFLTADEVGFGVNVVGSQHAVALWLIHWKET
jgi:hypothetical protein